MAVVPTLAVEVDFTGNPTADYSDILENAYGVVSFWRMNSTSTFLDSVGDNDGAIVGTPTTTAGPHSIDTDLALAFDGTSDGATVASNATLVPDKGDFAVEGFVKLPSLPGATEDLVTKRGSWLLQVTSAGKLVWTVKDDTSTASVTSTGALALNTYYHVVGYYDGAEIGLIINGILDVTAVYSSGWELGNQPLRFAITPSTAAPTYGTNVQDGGATGTVTIAKPASTASGDFLIAQITHHANDNLDTASLPSGWAILDHVTTDTSTGLENWLFWKIAGGAEPANYTWTITGGTVVWNGAISRITGVDNVNPICNPVQGVGSTSATSLSTGSHLGNVDNCMVLAFFAQQGTSAFSEDSGTEQYDFGANFRIALSSQTQATASALAVTGTHSTADDTVAVMVILSGTGSAFIATTLDDWAFWSQSLDTVDAGIHYAARNAGPGSWTAITTDVRSLDVPGANRQYELDRHQAGTSQVSVRDLSKNYDPGNTSSIHYPNVIPMRRIRGRGTWNSTTYNMFLHYVERWPTNKLGRLIQEVQIGAVDAFDLLALAGVEGTLDAGFSGTQINELLSRALWPVADRAIDTGQYVMAPHTISDGTKALPLIQDIADSEGGVFFVDAGGIATFHDAAHRGTQARSTTSQATFCDNVAGGGIIYQGIEPSFDKDRIVNDWTVTPDPDVFGSEAQRLVDSESVFQYGLRSRSLSSHLASNADALARCGGLLNETAQPTQRFDTMTVIPTTTAGYDECLDMRISDRITVLRGTAPGWGGAQETKECFVEGKKITVPAKLTPWTFTFQLSPVSSGNYFDTIMRGEPVSYWRMDTIT